MVVPQDARHRTGARTLAGRANTTVLVTLDELAELEHRIEELLAPYVLRKDADSSQVPAGARPVRVVRHTLPGRARQEDEQL